MRVKLWNRFIIAITGLLLLAAGILGALCALGFTPSWLDLSWLESGLVVWQRIVLGAVSLALVLLGVHNICMLFARKNTKGFITQRTDFGNMSISMKALDTMARKCVNQHQELQIKSTKIYRVKNGIAVLIRLLLDAGVNIPLTVSALQKQIKQYIVSCSGVDVYEVQVLVETNQPEEKKKHEKQQEIVVDNRKPDIEPEPVVIEKEVSAEETAEELVHEVAETVAPVEEEAQEAKLVVERKLEDIAAELENDDLFAGFETLAGDVPAEDIPSEENEEVKE